MMNRSFRGKWLLLLAFCFTLFSVTAHAQAISGDLTGKVFDSSGAAIPGATVVAVNDQTGVGTTTQTTAEGVYRFANLPIGKYSITASASGFQSNQLKNVEVVLNNTLTANLTLSVGTVGTTVEVSASAAGIDTTTAQLQTTFDAHQVLELPQTGQGSGVYNLALLGAGVTSQGGVGQGVGPAISGQRPDNNSFFLDGISNNSYINPAPLVVVSNEAVGEFTLLQNNFSPEFGGGSGGLFNTLLKSGGNQIHGAIYEYLQNRDLNAVNSIDSVQGLTSNPRFDSNRFGADIGGPIIKNKFFYYGDFEYNPVGQSAVPGSPLYAPTAAGYSILNGIPGLSKNNLSTFEKYIPAAPQNDQGAITVSGQQIPVGSIAFVSPTFTNTYDAVVSLDYNLSDKDQLRGRWVYNKSSGITAGFEPAFDVSAPNDSYLYTLSEFHNFSPTMQNEFRLSFSRNLNVTPLSPLQFPGLAAFPQIQIDELNGLEFGPTNPSGTTQNLFQATNNLTKVWGKHTLKFGGTFIDTVTTNYFIQRVTGNYEYSTLGLYLTDQAPDTLGERSAGATSDPVGFLQYAGYVNDDFRVTSNLTINLGMRYEYVTQPVASRYQGLSSVASAGGLTFAEPHFSPTNFVPKIGFAYSPGKQGAWSIRGGFSQSYDLVYGNLTANAAPPYFQQTNDCPGPLCPQTGFLASGGLPGNPVPLPTTQAAALGAVSSYTFGGKRPYGLTYTLGVQHVLWNNYTFEARYVGTRGVHLWNQDRINIQPLVNANNYIPTFFTMPASFAGLNTTLAQVKSYVVPGGTAGTLASQTNDLSVYGSTANITAYAPQGYSSYNGLQLQLNRRYSNGLAFVAAYTWSHTEDDSTATNFSTYLTPRRAQDFGNLAAEWATSALDHRQRLTITPIYEFRPFKNGNWLMKNVIGNWNISGTYTYESPELATVQSGLDSNLNGDTAGDRTIINPNGAANVGTGVTGYNSLGQVATSSATIVAYVANNPNARYVTAGSGALANGGRNTFPLFPTNNIDLGVKKRLSFRERYSFDIGAQMINIFNHPQWTGGSVSDVATQAFTGARNDLLPNDPLFGRFDQFYSSNSRTVQVFAHIVF